MKEFDLRKWRLEQPFTQQELADILGVSHDTVGRIEQGDLSKNVCNIETWIYRYENDIKFRNKVLKTTQKSL